MPSATHSGAVDTGYVCTHNILEKLAKLHHTVGWLILIIVKNKTFFVKSHNIYCIFDYLHQTPRLVLCCILPFVNERIVNAELELQLNLIDECPDLLYKIKRRMRGWFYHRLIFYFIIGEQGTISMHSTVCPF